MAKTFAVSIAGWDEHQERSDRKNNTWFKFYSKACDGHLWINTGHEEKTVWLYLLCQRNRQGCVTIHTSDAIVAAVCQVKESAVLKILSRLAELGAVADESRHHPGSSPLNAGITPSLDRETDREEKTENSTAAAPLTAAWLAGKWNEICGGISSIQSPGNLNPKRKREATARLKEHPNCDDWIAALTRVANSTKCQGLENDPGKYQNWKAEFDWLIKPGRLDQILEGKWDSRRKPAQRPNPFQEQLARELAEKSGGVA